MEAWENEGMGAQQNGRMGNECMGSGGMGMKARGVGAWENGGMGEWRDGK